jgi:hypothetical protein
MFIMLCTAKYFVISMVENAHPGADRPPPFQRLIKYNIINHWFMEGKNKRHPKGHFMGIGMMIGMFLGILFGYAMSIIFDDVTMLIILGPGGGAGIGISIGMILEAKYNPDPRPPTPEEKSRTKKITILLIITALIGLALFLWQFLQ